MKIIVQVVLHADDDTETVVREAFTVQRGALTPDTVGLQLEEAKDLLSTMQDTLAVQNRDDTSALVRSRIADRARVNSSGANSLPAGSYPNV